MKHGAADRPPLLDHRPHGRRVVAALLALLAAACDGSRDEYRASTDLGPAIRALGSDDLDEEERALARIAAVGTDALPALEKALAAEPAAVRRGVVEALERIDDPAAVRVLTAVAARDADLAVRYEAIGSLGVRKAPEAEGVVEAALDDPEPRIRLAAAGACAALCTSPRALSRVVVLALGDQPLANGIAARATLVQVLGGPDPERRERVNAAIQRQVPAVLARSGEGEEAVRAALLASDIGDPAGAEVLARAARASVAPVLRLQAIHALGTVGRSADVAALAALDGEATFGDYAYDALRRLAIREVAGAEQALDGWRGARPVAALPPPPGAR